MKELLKGLLRMVSSMAISKASVIILQKVGAFIEGDYVEDAKLIKGVKVEGNGDPRKVKLFYKSGKVEVVAPMENLNKSFDSAFGRFVYLFRWDILNDDSMFEIFEGENGLRDIIVYKSGLVGYLK